MKNGPEFERRKGAEPDEIDRHQHADQPGFGDEQHGKQSPRRDHAAAHAVQGHQESEQGGEQYEDQAQAIDRDVVSDQIEALGHLQCG